MQHTKLSVVVGLVMVLGSGCGGEEEPMSTSLPYPGASAGYGEMTDDGGDDEDDEDDEDEDEDEDDGNEETDGGGDPGGADDDTEPADDDDAATTGPADSGEPPPGDSGTPPPSDSGGTEDPGLMMCLDMAANDCEDCACMNCLSQLQACQADAGCVAIRMCAQQNGCTGIGCLGPCGSVIDANGGPFGPSAGLASTLSDCYTGACPGC